MRGMLTNYLLGLGLIAIIAVTSLAKACGCEVAPPPRKSAQDLHSEATSGASEAQARQNWGKQRGFSVGGCGRSELNYPCRSVSFESENCSPAILEQMEQELESLGFEAAECHNGPYRVWTSGLGDPASKVHTRSQGRAPAK